MNTQPEAGEVLSQMAVYKAFDWRLTVREVNEDRDDHLEADRKPYEQVSFTYGPGQVVYDREGNEDQ